MLKLRFVAAMLSAGLMILGVGAISGQDYPSKPIRLVSSSVGSGTDFATRVIVPGLSASLGQQVIVDNRPGGIVQGEIVSRAQPDGYTLLSAGSSFVLGPLLSKTPYDPGVEAVSSSPQELAAAMKADIARVSKLIKDTGIKVD